MLKKIKKFFSIVVALVGAYIMVGFVIVAMVYAFSGGLLKPARTVVARPENLVTGSTGGSENQGGTNYYGALQNLPVDTGDDGNFFKPPSKTNVLVLGYDYDNVLTDIIFVACFDRDAAKINILSVPRDLYTQIPAERLARMRDAGMHPPSSGVMKINALRGSYGKSHGMVFLKEQLGEMLGINIHYHVEIELPAFRKIVDAVGPIEMEIPHGGLYYADPEQNLFIAIPGGMQKLDGAMSEGVVRYRRYVNGDIDRIMVQHEFMKQLFRQALKKENLMRDPIALINVLINYVRTDIGIDLAKYIPYIPRVNENSVNFFTIPGEGAYIGDISYFLPDRTKLPETINRVFYTDVNGAEKKEKPPQASDSRQLRIAVYNGTWLAGIASSFADTLRADGYNIVQIDNYGSHNETQTRILVRTVGTGGDLLPYFSDAVIKEDANLPEGYDIVIIVGKKDT
ncbi:MAG: LCP family protein [Defluviitaleaceae bacterium]|nr:LCP family protein [Defluviitaleaceae bacterium]